MTTPFTDHAIYLAAFDAIPGVGRSALAKLAAAEVPAKTLWTTPLKELTAVGLSYDAVTAIGTARQTVDPVRLVESFTANAITVTSILDETYPPALREIYDPPIVLYSKGTLPIDESRIIAVVGSRKMTSYGKQITEELVTELVLEGFTIVSGLAYGIDSCAHKATLAANGRTIAVLGGGLLQIYPPDHANLARDIATQHGALLSELAPSEHATKGSFPARNRIISGLSVGVLVTEADEHSGTMITVAQALEQNRDVLAIPGPITSPRSQGTNKLIKQGAHVVTSVDDVLEALVLPSIRIQPSGATTEATPEESALCALLTGEPKHTDQLVREANLSVGQVLATLAMLELKGRVAATNQNQWHLT